MYTYIVHLDLDLCGHWVQQLYRKNQVAKIAVICYVVIGEPDYRYTANFKKPQILRVFVCNDWDWALDL